MNIKEKFFSILDTILTDTGTTLPASLAAIDAVVDNILSNNLGAGSVFYVDSAAADDTGNGLTAATAKKTIDAGVNLCTANNGDVVLIYASGGAAFDEDANTGGVLMDTAGVTLQGVNRPLINNTNGAATALITITAARCSVKGLYLNNAVNGVIGISLDGAGDDYCVIADNIIWGDMELGIYINDSDWNQIYNNHIAEMGTNTHSGIKISGSSRSNRIIGNWIDNTDYGIWLNAGTQTQNLIWRNSIAGSGGGTAKGIYLDGAGVSHTEIKDNNITDCVIAIDDSGTSTDISNNKQEDSIDNRVAGKTQIAVTTIDLNQVAGSYDLFTGTTQDGILESLAIRLPTVDCSDDAALTSISIQTDDVTVSPIISNIAGAVGNLTSEAQLVWEGVIFIKVGTKIQLTIAGGASDAATVCDVVAKFVSDTDGGYLA